MSETEQMVEFWLPLDQLDALIKQAIKEPLSPMNRKQYLIPLKPGDRQKLEELMDVFSPEEFEAVDATMRCLIEQFETVDDAMRSLVRYGFRKSGPLEQRDYTASFSVNPEDLFTFHVPRDAIPGIRKCLELAVASRGPRGWMGRCLSRLEALFATLEGS